MSRPWWQTYPRSSWGPQEWAAWDKAGRPKVPRDPALEKLRQPLNATLPPAQPKHLFGGFRLDRPKPSADEILAEWGIESRRRRSEPAPSEVVRRARRPTPASRDVVMEGDGRTIRRVTGRVLAVR